MALRSNGIRTDLGGGVSFSIDGRAIDEFRAPDTQGQSVIDRSRQSSESFYNNLQGQRDNLYRQTQGQADQYGQQAADAFRQMAKTNTDQAERDALTENTYAAYRAGNAMGSANLNRRNRIYKTAQAQRIADEAEARARGEAARGQYMSGSNNLQSMLEDALGMGARTDRALGDAYLQTEPFEMSRLEAYLDDVLSGLSLGSGARAEGYDNAYRDVFR